ncbi:phosphoribosyl-AMP cyclohydrolase [Caldivirga sp.]|uniref:phosphoribosyl-AMP cyclohydrolase n=1 Tax=Caldivirga sp. TaxID=2080243 RepID=UPI0025C5DC73|nr:phosphoribosyl-AMP cyclohydrolase [Caldivirga sp.]
MLPNGVNVLKLSPEEAAKVAESLWYRHTDGTVIAVAQDYLTKDVLMIASMNKEAVLKTLTTGMVHYWSLSRKRLWLKGETSGHYQYLVDFRIDCDGDALLLKVYQVGNACHLGTRSCFDARYVNRVRHNI